MDDRDAMSTSGGGIGSSTNFGDSSASGPVSGKGGSPDLGANPAGGFATDSGAHGGAQGTAEKAKQGAAEAVDTVKEQLAGVGGKASTVAGQASEKAATGLESAAQLLREKGADIGGPGVTQIADKLETAAGSLHDVRGDQMVAGLESMVRRNPTQAMLVAAGLGFLVAKATK